MRVLRPSSAPSDTATAEDIEANLDAVMATDRFSIPGSIVDEVAQVCDRLGFGS